jgi:hypothetical protein
VQAWFGPVRKLACVELDGRFFELASFVSELRDATTNVERKAYARQAHDKLGDVEAREPGRPGKLDA